MAEIVYILIIIVLLFVIVYITSNTTIEHSVPTTVTMYQMNYKSNQFEAVESVSFDVLDNGKYEMDFLCRSCCKTKFRIEY